VVYGLGVFAARAMSFVSLPIMTRLLTPADYGVIQLIEMTFDMLTILAGSRIGGGIYRFYHKAETEEEKHGVLSTALLFLLASFSLIAAAAWFSADWMSQLIFESDRYATAIRVASLSFPWMGTMGVTLGYLRMLDRAMSFVLVGLVKSVIQLVMVVVLLGFLGMDLTGVFVATLISNTLTGGWLVWTMLKVTGVSFVPAAARDLLRFGLPLVVTQVASFFTTFADRYFLQKSFGEAEVGLYALGYTFGFLLMQVGYTPFSHVWGPIRFEVAKRDDPSPVIARTFVLINCVFLTVGVALGLFTFDLLRIMSPATFWRAADFVPVILVAYVFHAWSGFFNLGIMIREQTKYITFADWVGAIEALAGYLYLIPLYGSWAAAWSTAAAFGVRVALIHWAAQRLWYVEYDWPPVVRLSVLAVATVVAGLLLPEMSLVTSIAVRTGIMILYGVILWNARIIPDDEKDTLRGWARDPRAAVRAYLKR
jgi:O-antigen/teichoic acid export membrane protein